MQPYRYSVMQQFNDGDYEIVETFQTKADAFKLADDLAKDAAANVVEVWVDDDLKGHPLKTIVVKH